MSFENSLAFAQQLDQQDSLAAYRSQFLFPQHEGKNMLYFTGNSLGLQPKSTRDSVMQELEDWAKYGVEGHFQARRPWYSYHEQLTEGSAQLVGALSSEVVVMNQLTVNLHLLLISFYRPSAKRIKILFETKPFPSDHYAFESHAKLHGLDPKDVLVEMQPRPDELTLRQEDILAKILELGDELALVCFGGVNYFTGQFFPLEAIAKAAHEVGAMCGVDLAHAAGNLPLHLHKWNIDFACWCSYKYLNSGPGGVSGAFVHERHHHSDLMRLAGWWGYEKETRFQMLPGFKPIAGAESWQISNAPVLSMAAHKAALDMFSEVGMEKLRKKAMQLTGFLEFVFKEVEKASGQTMDIITPTDPEQRGCQLSVIVKGHTKQLVRDLAAQGIIVDWREPNVIRLAPVPFYNSFEDIYHLGQALIRIFTQHAK